VAFPQRSFGKSPELVCLRAWRESCLQASFAHDPAGRVERSRRSSFGERFINAKFPQPRTKLGRSRTRIVAEVVRRMLPLSRSRIGEGIARFMFLNLEAQKIMNGIPCF